MARDGIARKLAALEATGSPSVVRFDADFGLVSRVAVLPSAFNPPTTAHLGLLELAAGLPGIQSIAALLSTKNVDKGLFGADLADRVGMLLAARTVEPALAVLAANAARIADQAMALREAFPQVGFDFVVGHDTLVRLFDERYYDDDMGPTLRRFFAHHRVVATNRGAARLSEVAAFLDQPQVVPFRERILLRELDEARASISSTAVRDGLGLPIEPVVPPVARYIASHGLYRASEAPASSASQG